MNKTRLAVWSGPRNISTSLMRSFANRGDCKVMDEPFYGAYLFKTQKNHPLRNQIIRDMNTRDFIDDSAWGLVGVPILIVFLIERSCHRIIVVKSKIAIKSGTHESFLEASGRVIRI